MYKFSLFSGVLSAVLSVVIGAFGAHYLKQKFTPDLLVSFETGVRYQFYHAIALLILGLYASHFQRNIQAVSWCFVLGTLLFSGSIYVLCLLKSSGSIGLRGLGVLTPIGGMLFIAAWLLWLRDIWMSGK